MTNTLAPGWYQDPRDARMVRYHDGNGWTEHVSVPSVPQIHYTVPFVPTYPLNVKLTKEQKAANRRFTLIAVPCLTFVLVVFFFVYYGPYS